MAAYEQNTFLAHEVLQLTLCREISNDNTEWQLSLNLFKKVFGMFEFAQMLTCLHLTNK